MHLLLLRLSNKKIKALHGNEIDKAKRLAEEAVKAAKNQGKQLEKISGQELAATGVDAATGAAETGGATGLEAQREDAAAKLDAAKLDAKAAVTVAKQKAQPELVHLVLKMLIL